MKKVSLRELVADKIIFAVLIAVYGNTAQQEVPKTAECDIINLWINR